ncbi:MULTISPECIES: sensor histidine kinase [Niastella]|uniref:Histidine kinase n=1 Tax=Niastella soli TaxID=2821487 RepID=A0ABS3Z328_9BACT|nr:two-component regulator propeller domain-containing protein [Niastella soli]MBO9204577.1 histidine kinase [Niastella soli]
MNKRTLLVLILCCPLLLFSQEYSYTHYDSRDGLGSSTVYCMTQDKQGFLWFGTETGVTRFDGSHFESFTKEEGLPDNDIIQVFADSKGRVWLAPFKKTVCYYYKGVIHNSTNDTLLKNLRIHDNVVQFAEDRAGNILLQEVTRVHLLQTNGQITTLTTNGKKPFSYISKIGGRQAGGFWLMEDGNIYTLEQNRFTLWQTVPYVYDHIHFAFASMVNDKLFYRSAPEQVMAMSLPDRKMVPFASNRKYEVVNSAVIDDSHAASCTLEGAFVYDVNSPDSIQHHLPGVAISNVFKDSEGSWWFTTMGNGVYRLNSSVALNAQVIEKRQTPIPSWLGQAPASKELKQSISTYKLVRKYASSNGKWEDQTPFTWFNHLPIINLITLNDRSMVLGSAFFLQKLTPDLNRLTATIYPMTVKALCAYQNNVIVATDKNVVAVDQNRFEIVDTLLRERATCVFSNDDTLYVGTLNGLYQLLPDKRLINLGEKIKALQGHITAVKEDANQVVWVATAGEGLIGYGNDGVVRQFSRHNGLSSNICRTLFYENGKLWVGTDKGVNRINVMEPWFPIQKYTISDGLSSDIIDVIYVTNKKVFIGTPEGITFFDEEKMTSQSHCDLWFTNITVAGSVYYPDDAPVLIPHAKNNIQFNYVAISYKSSGDIRYRYRLLGLDSTWRETRETLLSYPALPSGDYQLQLQAINKFDVYSQVLTSGFTVEKLLYEKTWFRMLIVLTSMAITSLVMWLIIRRIRKREQEKTSFVKRINELEQLSRKAQMNPHFIFNSLNSIQQYVMDADITGANKFISGFSRLIRQTLDFSSRPEISLEEELDYLANYMEIERTRLENAFSWKVVVDESVKPADYYIPPMILQPFVENSVRHGLRFRRDKNGIITIAVKRDKNHLVCMVEDNGIGRKAAMQFKSVSPINYQSKGLSLTADRIEMFNREHEQKITMHIDDLEDEAKQALGTRVIISFPVI